MADRFFDRYPRFYETTATRLAPNRFHQRWRAIVETNWKILSGARVLDLGSHDGRWAFAALRAGAAYVKGIEGRPELLGRAVETFDHYGVPRESYDFACGDAVAALAEANDADFDVVLNLGFYYHTLKHLEVAEGCDRIGASSIIIDTAIDPSEQPVIAMSWDDVGDPRHAIDHTGGVSSRAPVGRPSRAALQMMLEFVGFELSEVDWLSLADDFTDCEEYKSRLRGTFVATRRR